MRLAAIVGVGMAIACSVASAQNPPVKMGLWETTRITIPSGAPPTTVKAQICLTPETFERSLGMMTKQQPGCTVNTVKTATGYAFDGICSLPNGGSMQLHGTESIDDSEHTSGSSQTTMTIAGKKMDSESRRTSRFVSASCGTVQPGKPAIMK